MDCTVCGREFMPTAPSQITDGTCTDCWVSADEESRLPSEEPLRHLEEDNEVAS